MQKSDAVARMKAMRMDQNASEMVQPDTAGVADSVLEESDVRQKQTCDLVRRKSGDFVHVRLCRCPDPGVLKAPAASHGAAQAN